jgi:hypothetical protein
MFMFFFICFIIIIIIIIIKQVPFAFYLFFLDFFPKLSCLTYVFKNWRAFLFFLSNERILYEKEILCLRWLEE